MISDEAHALLMLFSMAVGVGVTWALLSLHLRLARARGWGHPVRKQGPKAHLSKEGTPTAAGWTFLPAAALASLPLGGLVMMTSAFAAAGIGLADDAAKLRGRREGVPARWRLMLQVGVGISSAFLLHHSGWMPGAGPWVAMGGSAYFLAYSLGIGLAFAATVNAVNFTDGADGLLAATLGGSLLAAFAAYFIGPHHPISTLEMTALSPMAGVLAAWWFFNRHPAKMFMGETGSYLLGAWVFVVARGDPWVLLALATIPLLELLSVVIQVVSFRTTGRRVFKMAPFHHHLELSGWSEKRLAKGAFVAQFALTIGILYARSAIVRAGA